MTTQTAAQRRTQARIEYDAYLATCPSRQLLSFLANKWVVLVLSALDGGPARYSELRRCIAGVSQKMLTQTLRGLERDGLVDREVTPTVPVTVCYSLTGTGRSLYAVVVPLKVWAEQNIQTILDARDTHAQAAADGTFPA